MLTGGTFLHHNKHLEHTVTLGFVSEANIAALIYDLYDGPSRQGRHGFTDANAVTTDNDAINSFINDLVTLNFTEIAKPLFNNQGVGYNSDLVIENITRYAKELAEVVNCNQRRILQPLFTFNMICSFDIPPAQRVSTDRISFNLAIDHPTFKFKDKKGNKDFYKFKGDATFGYQIDINVIDDENEDFNLSFKNSGETNAHISDPLTVTNDRFLFFNKNISEEWVVQNGDNPEEDSRLGAFVGSDLEINNGATMEIGDPDAVTFADVHFCDGSRLILQRTSGLNNPVIIVNNNSSLVIEEGAIFEYHPNTTIILNGPNAVLEIKGQLQIVDGATFTVEGGAQGFGHVRFFKNENTNNINLVTSPTNDGRVLLNGTGNTDEILEIDGTQGLKIGEDVLEFTVTNGEILMGENSKLQPEVKDYLYMETVSVGQLNAGHKHRGIYVCGVPNTFLEVNVDGGTCGFTNYINRNVSWKLILETVIIDNCDYGINSIASGVTFLNGEIKGYSIAGWKSAAGWSNSLFNGVTIKNTNMATHANGMDVSANQTGVVTLSYSNLIDNEIGTLGENVRMNLHKCNSFQNSTSAGIQLEARSYLNMDLSSFNAFEENKNHFVMRYHGTLVMDGAHSAFYNQGGVTNPLICWASLEPNVQPFLNYVFPYILPTGTDFFEDNPLYNQTAFFPNIPNYFLDERGTRNLTFDRSIVVYANLAAWKTAFLGACGYAAPLIVQVDPTYKPVDGAFAFSRYTPIGTVTLGCGPNSSQIAIDVCRILTDSLYKSNNPDYNVIIGGLSDIATCTYSNNSAMMKTFLNDAYSHLLMAYSKGVTEGQISISEDSLSPTTNLVLKTIDSLYARSSRSIQPWSDNAYNIMFAKAEVLRLASHRDAAIGLLNTSLGSFPDSLDQIYIYKYICINEAENAYLDSLVSIDSIFIQYPCYNDSLGSMFIVNPLSDQRLIKENKQKNGIKLYPNPSSSQINIETNNEQIIEKLIIYDIRGMVIKTLEIKENLSIYNLNIEEMNTGNYVIQVITNQSVYNRQIIIIR